MKLSFNDLVSAIAMVREIYGAVHVQYRPMTDRFDERLEFPGNGPSLPGTPDKWRRAKMMGPVPGLCIVLKSDTTCTEGEWASLCAAVRDGSPVGLVEQPAAEEQEAPVERWYLCTRLHARPREVVRGTTRIGQWDAVETVPPLDGKRWIINGLTDQRSDGRGHQSLYLWAFSPKEAAEKAQALLDACGLTAG